LLCVFKMNRVLLPCLLVVKIAGTRFLAALSFSFIIFFLQVPSFVLIVEIFFVGFPFSSIFRLSSFVLYRDLSPFGVTPRLCFLFLSESGFFFLVASALFPFHRIGIGPRGLATCSLFCRPIPLGLRFCGLAETHQSLLHRGFFFLPPFVLDTRVFWVLSEYFLALFSLILAGGCSVVFMEATFFFFSRASYPRFSAMMADS